MALDDEAADSRPSQAAAKPPAPASKQKILASILVGAAFGFVGAMMLDRGSSFLAPSNDLAPPGSVRLAAIVMVLGALHFLTGVYHWRRRRADSQRATRAARPKLRRRPRKAGWSLLKYELILAALLVFTEGSHWKAWSIGLIISWHVGLALFAGVVCYVVFGALSTLLLRAAGRLDVVEDVNMRTMAYLWPRSARHRIGVVLGLCAMNPVIEEMLFRGILVRQLDVATGAFCTVISLGLAINVGNHAYQGAWAMRTHVPFYLIAVGLLYSPAGLWGAIGFHFAGDVVPVLTLRGSLRRYRNRYRQDGRTARNVADSESLFRRT